MKKSILAIFSAFILFSCNKDEDECTISAEDIAGPYKVTAATYKADAGSPEIDYFNILYSDACERDDVVTFNANGTYLFTDAGVKCVPAGDDTGSWSLVGTTSMLIDGDAVILESFNCQQLVIVNTDTQAQGDRLKLTLTRQ